MINNSSILPLTFLKRIKKIISSILFSSNDIAKIIQDLDSNKARGHDVVSILMLKICGESVSKPLEIIFKSCLEKISLLMNGKKQMWFQSIKMVIRKCQETIDLFYYFQYVERYLNVKYITLCLNL